MKLTTGLTLSENFSNFIASVNGATVTHDGNQYTAMDMQFKGGQWVVDLYSTIDCDQPQITVEVSSVEVING